MEYRGYREGDERTEERYRQRGRIYPGADAPFGGNVAPERGYQDYREGYRREERFGPSRSHLKCRDIMTTEVTTCYGETPIREVARLMRDEDIGSLPVIDEAGKLTGIVTDRDLVVRGLNSSKDDDELFAADCMSDDVYTARANDRVVEVIREMGDHQVRRLPVVDGRDRLVGIIAMADVTRLTERDRELAESFEEISRPSFMQRVRRWFDW
jgi:CBS domain-containing protein